MVRKIKEKTIKDWVFCSICGKRIMVEMTEKGFYVNEETIRHQTKHKEKITWVRQL